MKSRRPHKEIDGVTWWWCNVGEHFVSADGFNKNIKTKCGLDNRCRECKSLYHQRNKERVAARMKAYREANPGLVKARKKTYYEANKGQVNAKGRAYHHANRAELLKKKKELYEKNRERYLARQKRYKDANREKTRTTQRRCYDAKADYYKTKSKDWYYSNREYVKAREKDRRITQREQLSARNRNRRLAHPELFRQWGRDRYARHKGAKGKYTRAQWEQKCEFWGWRCYLCGASLEGKIIHADHRKPLKKGGSNWIANVAPACPSCNCSKQDKTEAEFRALIKKSSKP
jgi:hypothetical protein